LGRVADEDTAFPQRKGLPLLRTDGLNVFALMKIELAQPSKSSFEQATSGYGSGEGRLFMSGFFEELQRRKVYRVAAAYIIAAGFIIQISSASISGVGFTRLEFATRDCHSATRISDRSHSGLGL
jgi:hypothetical protein